MSPSVWAAPALLLKCGRCGYRPSQPSSTARAHPSCKRSLEGEAMMLHCPKLSISTKPVSRDFLVVTHQPARFIDAGQGEPPALLLNALGCYQTHLEGLLLTASGTYPRFSNGIRPSQNGLGWKGRYKPFHSTRAVGRDPYPFECTSPGPFCSWLRAAVTPASPASSRPGEAVGN